MLRRPSRAGQRSANASWPTEAATPRATRDQLIRPSSFPMKRFGSRNSCSFWRALLLAVVLVPPAVPASAEAMDKERAPSDISRALVLALLLALPAAAVHRWLLLPLFIFGPVRE